MSSLLTASLVFTAGLVLLGKGSDLFVEAAARIAKILGVSELIIGLTLIAVGTSLPELAAGVVASYSGETEIVLGNVVGSNIANIALILGAAALIAPLMTEREMFYRDGYMLLGITSIFYYFAYDGIITNVEGVILILLFFLYTAFLLRFKPRISRIYRVRDYVEFLYELDKLINLRSPASLIRKGISLKTHLMLLRMHLRYVRRLLRAGRSIGAFPVKATDDGKRREYQDRLANYLRRLQSSILYELLVLLVTGVTIYLGAEFFISGAVDIAKMLGIAPSIIGLTIVSIGTSLPELAVSLQSAKKGFGNMVVGNIIGSNISNTTLIIGVCALISPVSLGVSPELIELNISRIIPFMIFISLLGITFIRSGWRIRRFEGASLILIYGAFLLWLVFSSGVT